MTPDERPPPQDLDAEMALLGAMLMDNQHPGTAKRGAAIVTGEMFALDVHKNVYGTLRSLLADGKPIDLVFFSDRARGLGTLSAMGGHEYLVELAESFGDASNVEHYARLVRSKWELRCLAQLGHQLHEDAVGYEARPVELVQEYAERIRKVEPYTGDKPVDWCDLVLRVPKWLTASRTSAIRTGVPSLDVATGGFDPRTLTILGARPSIGKSAMALQWAFEAAKQNRKTLFVSVEMHEQTCGVRGVAVSTGVPVGILKHRTHPDALEQYAQTAARRVPRGSLLWLTKLSRVDHIIAAIHRSVQDDGVNLVIIDHFHDCIPARHEESQYREYAKMAESFKMLAKGVEAHVVLVAQLNRELEKSKRRPILSDLRGCGDLEQKADYVVFLHRCPTADRFVSDGTMPLEILLAKNRNGPLMTVEGTFDKATMSFSEHARALSEYETPYDPEEAPF